MVKKWLGVMGVVALVAWMSPGALAQVETQPLPEDLPGIDEMIFHGYIDFEFKDDDFAGKDQQVFDNHHFNLFFGSQIASNLRALGEIEIEHTGEEFKVEFAEIEWKPLGTDWLELVAGAIIVPFGLELRYHASPNNLLISRPLAARSIIPGTWTDPGVVARGTIATGNNSSFFYHVYANNGLSDKDKDGVFEQKDTKTARDVNDDKALGFQIGFLPFPGLEVGASFQTGKWDLSEDFRYVMYGGHVDFKYKPFTLLAEGVVLDVEGSAAGGGDATLPGFYVLLAYDPIPKWQVVARFDWVDNEDGVVSTKQSITPGADERQVSIGLSYKPQPWLKLKVEYFNRELELEDDQNAFGFQVVANW
ncbi:MAG: outer membrane beta-barrel protein [Nitrospinota bacterium]